LLVDPGILQRIETDEKALARDRAQGVFTQTFVQFSNRMISAYRLKQGAANMKKYADIFARADRKRRSRPYWNPIASTVPVGQPALLVGTEASSRSL
ncbi:lytic murein transglycosylase, partial [Mesorhizobium sp. M8A.F.Ca.ET.202.01.1.1]|uniref:lytic murein transglycosylase n=1 Tax=Mesorhizobium sp. M8A.F.Ca.ET.202.01.1.1 TaxID=2563967 RepID=UPI001FDEBF3D